MTNKLSNNGSSAVGIAIATFSFIVMLTIGYIVYLQVHKSYSPVNSVQDNTRTSSISSSYKVLSPATVPPKVSECSASLIYLSSGNPSPLQCPNGELNIQAWNALAATEPTVMKLGYTPTKAQVSTAICADANAANQFQSANVTAPIETSAYQIASIYYGWHFSINASGMIKSGC